mmetsp:Transcript_88566/g.255458  ORF Transcript_88566/g.255458 Transcript_88566/m.255458 type:complete len:102 (+) Transcript_88566:100-405(+)
MRFMAVVALALAVCGEATLVFRGQQQPSIANNIDHEAFAKNWHQEWEQGRYPTWRETRSKTWNHEEMEHLEDHQSDGKPSPGLTGEKVGAYLPMPLPRGGA